MVSVHAFYDVLVQTVFGHSASDRSLIDYFCLKIVSSYQLVRPCELFVLDCYRRRLQRQGIPETLMPAALKQLNHFVVEKLADLERLAKR